MYIRQGVQPAPNYKGHGKCCTKPHLQRTITQTDLLTELTTQHKITFNSIKSCNALPITVNCIKLVCQYTTHSKLSVIILTELILFLSITVSLQSPKSVGVPSELD